MTANWLKTRQTKYTAYVTVYILVILAVLGATNWLANRHNKSVDTTANKQFSLSDQTEKVVKNLKKDVKVTYYDQSRNFGGSTGGAKDLLDRYDNLSTKLSVDYVDPVKKPQLARAAGITNMGTIIVDSGTKREQAKSLTEEEITSALIRSLKEGERNACFVTGSGERNPEDTNRGGYSTTKELLEKNNYKVRTIALLQKPEIPADCTVVIVAGPHNEYIPPAVDAIKKYVENGGRLLLMLDPPLRLGKSEVAPNPGLVKMAADWGVTLNADLAIDTSPVGQLFGFDATVPVIADYDTHAIVKEMKGTMTALPMSGTVDVKSVDKVTPEKLFSTSGSSFAVSANDPGFAKGQIDPSKGKKGPFALAAAGTYKGAKEGRFVVVGSSEWAGGGLVRSRQLGNSDLFMNMMNWLTSDEDLISIRPKDPEDRPLSLSKAQMSTIFFGSVIGLPLLVIASGIMVWFKRR